MSIEATLAICAIASAAIAILSTLAVGLIMHFASPRLVQVLINVASYSVGLFVGFAAGTAALIALD